MATIAVLDYFLTLEDEVCGSGESASRAGLTHCSQITYIWKKRRSWMFYAFLLVNKALPSTEMSGSS